MQTAAIVVGLLGAASSASQAIESNKANKRAQASQNRAAGIQIGQLNDSAAVEREKRLQESRRLSAHLRVAAAESGLSLGTGTTQALQNQVQTDLDTNLGLLDRNLATQSAAVRTGAEANINALQAQQTNPLLATFTGGLTGVSTGLSIGSAFEEN